MPTPRARRLTSRLVTLAALAALSACAGQQHVSSVQEAAQYQARAKRSYAPPGPKNDPWGPYIVEAAAKYDVPERWVREVMRAESSGRVYETSAPGAMGLMQVMPGTFDELRARYSLGDDPYDPHDNIMAGTAYVRELYDIYGAPGFLAAYNAGPGRFDDYLSRNRPLPDETRNYVAKIGPHIQDSVPQRPSQGSQLAMNQIPINIPSGPRYPTRRGGGGAPVALADNRYGTGRAAGSWYAPSGREPVHTLALPEPPRLPQFSPQPQYAAASPPVRRGFGVFPQAMADTPPSHRGSGSVVSGSWAIQVGAFVSESQAQAAAETARGQAREVLGGAHTHLGAVHQANATLYRARLTGLSRDAAVSACERLSHRRDACIVISPNSQS